jgi:hypothetical protein
MTRHVLDAGALIALDENDRTAWVRLKNQLRAGTLPATHGGVVAQVWRDPRGRQARLAAALKELDVEPLDASLGRAAGELLARTGSSDVVDAAVVAMARPGDVIITSDRGHIESLLAASGRVATVVDC